MTKRGITGEGSHTTGIHIGFVKDWQGNRGYKLRYCKGPVWPVRALLLQPLLQCCNFKGMLLQWTDTGLRVGCCKGLLELASLQGLTRGADKGRLGRVVW